MSWKKESDVRIDFDVEPVQRPTKASLDLVEIVFQLLTLVREEDTFYLSLIDQDTKDVGIGDLGTLFVSASLREQGKGNGHLKSAKDSMKIRGRLARRKIKHILLKNDNCVRTKNPTSVLDQHPKTNEKTTHFRYLPKIFFNCSLSFGFVIANAVRRFKSCPLKIPPHFSGSLALTYRPNGPSGLSPIHWHLSISSNTALIF
jgi:hypothetical protein